MPVRPVLRYPDAILKQVSAGTPKDASERRSLANDLVDTMRAGPATVGLAAPQIGVRARAFVLDVSSHPKAATSHGLLALFDPVVMSIGDAAETMREGCLSVPDLTANVRRTRRLVLQATDEEGASRVVQAEGFEARAIQHEIDHLDGFLILDRVSSAADLFARRVYR